MMTLINPIVATTIIVALVSAQPAFAQRVDVGVIGTALLSVAPENGYVGNPYLDNGIGGTGPGFGSSLDVALPSGFTIAAEFSTARMTATQEGRLVGGGPVNTTFNDPMVTGLIGWGKGRHHRFTILAGAGRSVGMPSIDGKEVRDFNLDDESRLVLTAGLNAAHHLSSRVSLVGTARYFKLTRYSAAEQLGISDHVYRLGGGLRIRLN
jgi:hypothetical protein